MTLKEDLKITKAYLDNYVRETSVKKKGSSSVEDKLIFEQVTNPPTPGPLPIPGKVSSFFISRLNNQLKFTKDTTECLCTEKSLKAIKSSQQNDEAKTMVFYIQTADY